MKTTISNQFGLKMLRALALTLMLGILGKIKAQTLPTDNPYRTFTGGSLPVPHWTDSIAWSNVINIHTYDNLAVRFLPTGGDSLYDWLPAYNAARDAAANAGGGVVFFPKLPQRIQDGHQGEDSSYYFTDNLVLKSRVIVRGETPARGHNDARKSSFLLPTFFQFPKYEYYPGNLTGTPNSTAFKQVVAADTVTNNTGLVNIDMNNAGISAHPKFYVVLLPGQTTSNYWARQGMRNWIVLSCRSNNSAIPSPDIPTGNIAGWNRWPWQYSSNIDLFVDENAVVVNNRLNDNTNNDNPNRLISSQDFGMTQYNIQGTPAGRTLTPAEAAFHYNDHYGILINRLKLVSPRVSPFSFQSYATPAQEPSLFAKGIVTTNNWVFKTSRVGIQVAGQGTIIADNVIRDDSNKTTVIDPTGKNWQTNRVATYENRGIDFSGWGAIVINNDIEVYRVKLASIGPTNYSADGEGWYAQGPSGADPRDHYIAGNVTRTSPNGMANALFSGQGKGFNGLYNCHSIQNVTIENNDNGCMPIYISGDLSTPGVLSNVIVRNNTNVRSVQMLGTSGGQQNYLYNNSAGCTAIQGITSTINYSCCTVSLNPNPVQGTVNTNTGLVPNSCTPCVLTNPCSDPTYPVVKISNPSTDIFVGRNTQTLDLQTRYNVRNGCTVDSVKFFKDNVAIGLANLDNDSTASLVGWNLPPRPYRFFISSAIYTNGGVAPELVSVSQRQIYVTSDSLLGITEKLNTPELSLYPNPSTSELFVKLAASETKGQVTVSDMLGRVHLTQNLSGSETGIYRLDVANLKAEIYHLLYSQQGQRINRKFVVER